MTIWAIVPVKPLRRGKSRLAGMLSEDQRTRLNRHLLERTLTALNEVPEIDHTLVVSRDPAALALTREMGGRTVLEDGAPQFNTALQRATIVAKAHGAHAVLILPADLPLIDPPDVRTLLGHGKKPPVVVIASDRRKDGTNALFVNPVGLFEYGYGVGSFERHCERARQAGARLEILDLPTLALDLDLPEDLEYLGGLEMLGIP
ncbi:MAG: 2-phospho-L-lactate guanylyltransferase [Anaerolineales bacterium]|nr:2-phospho-L-lactate guanylyltransferase [Anaerolineales bacterium]